jgi:hypothetical protein
MAAEAIAAAILRLLRNASHSDDLPDFLTTVAAVAPLPPFVSSSPASQRFPLL